MKEEDKCDRITFREKLKAKRIEEKKKLKEQRGLTKKKTESEEEDESGSESDGSGPDLSWLPDPDKIYGKQECDDQMLVIKSTWFLFIFLII